MVNGWANFQNSFFPGKAIPYARSIHGHILKKHSVQHSSRFYSYKTCNQIRCARSYVFSAIESITSASTLSKIPQTWNFQICCNWKRVALQMLSSACICPFSVDRKTGKLGKLNKREYMTWAAVYDLTVAPFVHSMWQFVMLLLFRRKHIVLTHLPVQFNAI